MVHTKEAVLMLDTPSESGESAYLAVQFFAVRLLESILFKNAIGSMSGKKCGSVCST